MRNVYLDHAAATPIRPEVFEAMQPYLREEFGNPLSLHHYGEGPSKALQAAREKVAALIEAQDNEIYFTASGSEANNMAVKGIAMMARTKGKGNHIVVSAVEHQSVIYAAETMGKIGFEVTEVPVDRYGLVDPQAVVAALRDDTVLVAVMLANGEIGTIEPVAEIASLLKGKGVPFLADAVDAVGRIPVSVNQLGVDMLSLSASQFYGPKGAAALYMRRGVRIVPLIDGGIQENGRRAGLEDVAAVVGLGAAAELAKAEMEQRTRHLLPIRDRLIQRLTTEIPHVYLTGHPTQRLPHHVSVTVEYIEGESMLLFLNMQGIAVSSGSTCTSKALKASHVLTALSIDSAMAQGSLVLTLGESNTIEDVDYVLEVLPPIIERLRQMSPIYPGSSGSGPASGGACAPRMAGEE